MECSAVRRVGLCWQRMLRKRVKWLLFKGVSECLKWSHQRIVCRELGCEAGKEGVVLGLCRAYLLPSRAAASRRGGGLCAGAKTPDTFLPRASRTGPVEFIR